MTAQELIAEGRRLQRRSVFLRTTGMGPVAALWHPWDSDEWKSTGQHCWITVDTRFIPGWIDAPNRFLSVFTRRYDDGYVVIQEKKPARAGIELFASEESIIAPIEAVFLLGSEAVGNWLSANGWERDIRYNNNFKDRSIVQAYQKIWSDQYPLYREDGVYAALGGWHWPCADHDWYELIGEQLLVLTAKDAEPWVETWRLQNGQYRVIERIT